MKSIPRPASGSSAGAASPGHLTAEFFSRQTGARLTHVPYKGNAEAIRNVLAGETHNVDDQLEWLDDDTVIYGMPRSDQAGVTDVWALDTDASADPQLLVEQAWSPSVVH